jgi:hypothetical protein
MASIHTSVPRGATSSALGAARECIVFAFGAEAGPAAALAWPRSAAPAANWREFSAATCTDQALARLRDALESSSVGFRLLLAGPETDVYLARSAALGCGAQADEIALCVTGSAERRVLCAHCKTLTRTGEAIGSAITCDGCSRSLLVYHHFSRRAGAYLGFMVNAEEVS